MGCAFEAGGTPESAVTAVVGYNELVTSKLVALDSRRSGPIKLSYSGIANRLDVSNQAASRWLQRLEEIDLIGRKIVSDGQWITIIDTGESAFRQEYADCRRIFETPFVVVPEDQVTGGMGEGRHYISPSGYMKQLKDRLSYEPFPGTLNVRLDDDVVRARARTTAFDATLIDGWEDNECTFGPATCYAASAMVGGDSYEPVCIIVSEWIHHGESQLEITAPGKLHDELDLDDDDVATVRIGEAEYE